MGEVDKTLWYLFVLGLVLIGVVYFVGLSTDIGSVKDAVVAIGNTFTGRGPNGQFSNYPGGATQAKAA